MKLSDYRNQIKKIEDLTHYVELNLSFIMKVFDKTLNPVLQFELLEDEDINYLYLSFIICQKRYYEQLEAYKGLILGTIGYYERLKLTAIKYETDIIEFKQSVDYSYYVDTYDNWLKTVLAKFNQSLLKMVGMADKYTVKDSHDYNAILQCNFVFDDAFYIKKYIKQIKDERTQ